MDRKTLEDLVSGCPFQRLLQLTLVDFSASEGWVALALSVQPEFSRSDTKAELHGGVIASLIDIAGDCAVALKVGAGVATISLHVDYLRFAHGSRAVATARILRCGRKIAVVDIDVRDEADTQIAVGRGTYSSAREK